MANGTPSLRIGVRGSKRILGVVPSEAEAAPKCLLDAVSFEREVRGQFTVCPLTPPRRGVMQLVCVDEVERPVVREIARAGQPFREWTVGGCRLPPAGEP